MLILTDTFVDLLNHLNEVKSNGPWKDDEVEKEEEEPRVRHRRHSKGTEKSHTPHSTPHAETHEYTEEQCAAITKQVKFLHHGSGYLNVCVLLSCNY